MRTRLIICLLLLGTLSLSVVGMPEALASERKDIPRTAYTITTALGLLADGAAPDSSINRGEFSAAVAKMLGFQNPLASNDVFDDVYKYTKNSGYIEVLKGIGVVTGDAGMFYPNEPITHIQMIKMLIAALGYESVALRYGGWPVGYLRAAAELKLSGNPGESITCGFAAELLYQAMDTPILKRTVYSQDYKYTLGGETPLVAYMDITKARGLLTDNGVTALTGDSAVNQGSIVAGGVQYRCTVSEAVDYLGMKVELYSVNHPGDLGEAIAVVPTGSNDVMRIASRSILDFQEGIYTVEQNGREMTIPLQRGYDLIYNGKAHKEYGKDIMIPPQGEVFLIDSGNGYDVVKINSFFDMLASDVLEEERIIFDAYNGERHLYLEELYHYDLTDAEGNIIPLSQVKKNYVLSVAKSKDAEYAKIIVSDRMIPGIVTQAALDPTPCYWIDDAAYPATRAFESETLYEAAVGKEGYFYLNVFGEIAYYIPTVSSSMLYGYLIDSRIAERGLDAALHIKLLSQNGRVEHRKASPGVVIDGVRTSAEAAKTGIGANGSLIRYRLNREGLVTEIDTAIKNPHLESEDSLYVDYESPEKLRFKKTANTFSGKIDINQYTFVFIIPLDESNADDREYMVRSSQYLKNDEYYDVAAYTANKNGVFAEAVVVRDTGGFISGDTPVALVEKITQSMDADGKTINQIYLYAADRHLKYPVEPALLVGAGLNGDCEVTPGDMIRYGLNEKGYIGIITLIFNAESAYENRLQTTTNPNSSDYTAQFRVIHGRIYHRQQSLIRVTTKDASQTARQDLESFYLPTFTAYVVDRNNKTFVRKAKADDMTDYMTEGNPAEVFLYTWYGNSRIMVIYR